MGGSLTGGLFPGIGFIGNAQDDGFVWGYGEPQIRVGRVGPTVISIAEIMINCSMQL